MRAERAAEEAHLRYKQRHRPKSLYQQPDDELEPEPSAGVYAQPDEPPPEVDLPAPDDTTPLPPATPDDDGGSVAELMTDDEAVSADAVVEFVVEWVDKKLAPLDARLTELEAKLDAALSRLDADAAKVIDLPEAEWRRARSRR